jgi:hypothetical protein
MESLGLVVDMTILKLIISETLNPGDFTITEEGFCRLNPLLARKLVMSAACCRAEGYDIRDGSALE